MRILTNAGVLAILLAMQTLTYSFGFSRLLPLYGALSLVLLAANWSHAPAQTVTDKHLFFFGFAGAFVLMHIARESMQVAAFVGDVRAGLKLGLVEFTTAVALVVFGIAYRRGGGMLNFFVTVSLGISAFVALNGLLEVTGVLEGAIEEGFQSRYSAGLLRWMPPLARSNGLFSILNRYAASLSVVFLVYYRREMAAPIRLTMWIGLVVCAYAAVALEHRGAIVPIVVAPVAYGLARRRWAALVPSLMLIAMVLVPVGVAAGAWRTIVVESLPNRVLDLSGDPQTVYDLSGREDIYSYGLKYLFSRQMGLFGDGPVFRDSLPGFRSDIRMDYLASNKIGSAPQTFGFHNGFLDVAISYGPVCAGLLLAFVGAAIVALARKRDRPSDATTLGLTNLAIVLSLNVLDGGFSEPNVILLSLIGTALAIAQAAGGRVRPVHGTLRVRTRWGTSLTVGV